MGFFRSSEAAPLRTSNFRQAWRAKLLASFLTRVLNTHGLSWQTTQDGLSVTADTLLHTCGKASDGRTLHHDEGDAQKDLADTAAARCAISSNNNERRKHPTILVDSGPMSDVRTPSQRSNQGPKNPQLCLLRGFCADLASIRQETLSRLQELPAIDQLPKFAASSARVLSVCEPSTSVSAAVVSIQTCLTFLTKMDSVQDVAMVRTNCAYSVLGSAFKRYACQAEDDIKVTAINCGKTRQARSQIHHVLQRLQSEDRVRAILVGSDDTIDPVRRKAFVQRLQRARKYVRLTKIFPESLLLAVPAVCVTRVDKLSHGMLDVLEQAQDAESLRQKKSIIDILMPLRVSVRAGLESMSAVSS